MEIKVGDIVLVRVEVEEVIQKREAKYLVLKRVGEETPFNTLNVREDQIESVISVEDELPIVGKDGSC